MAAMVARNALAPCRGSAIAFARTFKRDRQRSLWTALEPVKPRTVARPQFQRSSRVTSRGLQKRGIADVVLPQRGTHAWLGNEYGGLRRGDKGKSISFRIWQMAERKALQSSLPCPVESIRP